MNGVLAEDKFKRGYFEQAAGYYSSSDKTFEEVSLKFLAQHLYGPLEDYLKAVLRKLPETK